MSNILYECFMAASETLNFTTAAEKIHITQPAFSRNIATLEKELGFPLFLRSKKNGLRITPAGLVMYNGITEIAKRHEELCEKAKRVKRGEEGKLAVSIMSGSCMDSATVSLIHRFQDKYPDIEIVLNSCNYAELIGSVLDGVSDVCFTIDMDAKQYPGLLYESAYLVDSYLAVPARLQCDVEKVYSLTDFKDEMFLLSEDAPGINEAFVEACREAGFEPKTKMVPDYETKMLWVEFGQGLAANSKDHYMKDSKHVNFIKVEELYPVPYAMAWNKDNYNPAIALFYSMFMEA